jgi:hypothetical protein
MDRIADYKLLVAETPGELENLVLEHIKKGWTPLAGAFSVVYPRKPEPRVTFYQSVGIWEPAH